MKVEYKKIEDKFDRYNIYNEALTWDTKKTFQTDADEINILWLLNIFIGVYNNDELCAEISYIVKPEYRKKGIGNNLIKYMLEYCKNDLNVKMVYVDILKTNKESVSQIEKNDFDFESFDDKIITFKRKLI